MGYRWSCLECDFISWNEDSKKKKDRHSTITGHDVCGGADVWSHPNGEHFQEWREKHNYPKLIDKTPKHCQRCGDKMKYVVGNWGKNFNEPGKGEQIWFCKTYHTSYIFEDYPSGMRV